MRQMLVLSVVMLAAVACKSSAPGPQAATPTAGARAATTQATAVAAAPTDRTPAQIARDEQLAARAAAVVNVFENRIPGFAGQLTPDGRRVVFGCNRDGSPQLYLGDLSRPAERAVALTQGPERVQGATLTRDGKWVLFTRDRAGDELSHVYRVALDGSGLADLTPGQGVRFDLPVLPLRNAELMVVARRAAGSPATSILAQPIAGGQARVVYQDASPVLVADVAPDGTRALLRRVVSPCESVVLELDLARGTARTLWPSEGSREGVTSATYSADGKTVYIATDQGGETSILLALDLAADRVRARWIPEPATARMDQVVPSPRGDVVAVRLDQGERTEIRLLDAAKLTTSREPKLPLGTARLGEVTPDGRWLSLSISTPQRPPEPYALDLDRGDLRPLRSDARPGLAALAPFETTQEKLTAADGLTIPLHAYLPKARENKKLPVIVSFHGGPAASAPLAWSAWAQYYVGLGYAWVEPNVRGSTGFGRSWELADNLERRIDVLGDMAAVNAWVRAQPWADPSRIVALGGDYGGWVVLMGLTRQPGLWSAGIDLRGVADLRTLLRSTDASIRAVQANEVGDLERDQALLAKLSPLSDAGKIAAPLFVYQGQNDVQVPRAQSDALVAALRARNVPVEYFLCTDEGHSLVRRDNQIQLLARSARFLEEHLGRDRPGAGRPPPASRGG